MRAQVAITSVWAALVAFAAPAAAIWFDPSNKTSVLQGSNLVIEGLLTYSPYWRNESGATPGMMQQPYYWYEAGVAWGALIDWSVASGNHSLDDFLRYSIEFQGGQYWNFMTFNQTSVEGNDDQGFWGVTAMGAAERNFTAPSKGYPNWLYYAQATFNSMAQRWDTSSCNGGLRWQIFTWNAGYDYKNMVSNGCLFHLAARLARFTNNDTFVDWAERIFDWCWDTKFIYALNPENDWPDMHIKVQDGAHTEKNCTDLSPYEWTYDQGLMMSGCAYMYNHTGDTKWLNRLQGLWSRAEVFFGKNETILYERACQTEDSSKITCTTDQRCFKGIFMRFIGLVMQLVPESKQWGMWSKAVTSAQAASWSCSGGTDGHTCGLSWIHEGWDGWYGLGEQICALDAFNTLLIDDFPAPYKASDLPEIYGSGHSGGSGGSSNSSSGGSSGGGGMVFGSGDAGLNSSTVQAQKLQLGTSDKAGAGVLTAVVGLFLIASSGWLLL